ncbi:hypothetical protein V2J09_024350 [Rumex salicifolius]
MCHLCTNYNDEMKPEEYNPAEASGTELNGSQNPLEVETPQGKPHVDGIQTACLTISQSGHLPLGSNLGGRDNQSDPQSNNTEDGLTYNQNGEQRKSSSDMNGDLECSTDGSSDEESGEGYTYEDPIDNGIWVPPLAENVDCLATFEDDDEDECADGVKWGKPSSLSGLEKGIDRIKEEKEKAMKEVKTGKFRTLVSELLKTVGIVDLVEECESWVDIISHLAWEAALFVKPDATEGKTMDPAGQLVKGLVFKKHAAHKHMPTKITKPKLMLIQGMLGHASGLSSFNSMIVQDKDNMPEDVRFLLEQLEMCRPNVVLMEKSAPRDVLEAVLKMGATLVVDMKLHRLERISRGTGSPIWSADIIPTQKLKQCDSLYFEKLVEEHADVEDGGKKPHKTLMFLGGSPTRLGCTILLKGSQSQELKKIKCVVQCAVVMAYHFILETSFLMDQELMFSTIVTDGGGINKVNKSSEEEIEVVSVEEGTSLLLSNDFHHRNYPSPESSNCSNFSYTKSVPLEFTSSNGIETSISGSILQHYSQVDGPAFISHGSNKLISQAQYKAVIQNVMGTLVPPADEYMRSYLPLFETGLNAQPENPISIFLNTKATGDAESNGYLNEEQSINIDNNTQPLSSSTETSSDLQKTGSDSDDCNGRKDDISSVLDSESILVLMSSRNALTGTVCEQSHFSHIKFYRNFDVPLGKFLRDHVLNQYVRCKACGLPPDAHFYYYAHHNKQLTIRVKQILDGSLLGGSERKLWMWSRCGKCKPEKEGNKNTTKRILISEAANGLSFGKFLELSFSNHSSFNRLSNCGHSLHKDFLYFFGLKCEKESSMVSMFKYSPVAKYTVSLPPRELEFNSPIGGEWLQVETKDLYTKVMLLFTEVSGYLKKIETRFSGITLNINGSIKEFIDVEKMLDAERFDFVENINNTCIKNGHSVRKLLCLNRLRGELFLEACIWNQRLQLLLSSASLSTYTATTSSKAIVEEKPNVDPYSAKEHEATSFDPNVKAQTTVSDDNDQIDYVAAEENAMYLGYITTTTSTTGDDTCSLTESTPIIADPAELTQTNTTIALGTDFLDKLGVSELFKSRKQRVWNPFFEIREDLCTLPGFLDSLRLNNPHSPDSLPTLSQILREENQRIQIPLCDDYVVSEYEGEISSIIACAVASVSEAGNLVDNNDDSAQLDEDGSTTLPRAESEPLWLRSTSSTSFESDMIRTAPRMSLVESRFSSFDGLNLLASLATQGSSHPQVSLGATEPYLSCKPKYSVVCLYATEFRALRDLSCPSELDYIASLSRCKIWDAKGGKSKSFFAKTLDDRLIIKEIRRTELESFAKFAPDYFQYMNQSFDSRNQTCLAKILGIYQVTTRKTKTGKEVKHDLMVMENLSFGRNIARQYDLKGALHARYTANADLSGDVLLDQNFVIDMNQSPMYVGQRAKRLLQRAVWNDTTFLNRINVMDYSLLVGVDTEGKELVCGIIDYLRQYTWDKQLETWVKSSLVVPRNVLPTIISPKEYKKRFRKFMDTHFLTVPDQWCSRRSNKPCKLCGIAGEGDPTLPPLSKPLSSSSQPSL